MKYFIAILLLSLNTISHAQEKPLVQMQTNIGTIRIELYSEKAPKTVENFLRYVNDGFYDGTLFHRVVANFIIQGGGYTTDYQKKPTREPIPNESENGLKNEIGTVAMARLFDSPHSATSQFFINVAENHSLDYQDMIGEFGYTVFGKVIEGMEVVKKIQLASTGAVGPFKREAPEEPIIIVSMTVEDGTAPTVSTNPSTPTTDNGKKTETKTAEDTKKNSKPSPEKETKAKEPNTVKNPDATAADDLEGDEEDMDEQTLADEMNEEKAPKTEKTVKPAKAELSPSHDNKDLGMAKQASVDKMDEKIAKVDEKPAKTDNKNHKLTTDNQQVASKSAILPIETPPPVESTMKAPAIPETSVPKTAEAKTTNQMITQTAPPSHKGKPQPEPITPPKGKALKSYTTPPDAPTKADKPEPLPN